MSSFDFMNVCRLCLAKDGHLHPIFGGESEVPTISLKITSCLPVKIAREDKLPQKICEQCLYKLDLSYEFWNLTVETEKQLLQWLSGVNSQNYAVTTILNQDIMKGEQSNENRLDGSMMQQVSGHQNSMNMGIDNMCISMIMPNNNQQQITSVPIDTSGSSVQNVQVIAGSSTQTTHDQITQSQTNVSTQQEEEEESSEDEENSDDECDGDEGLPIKEESEEDPNNSRTIEPTTFVNVSLHCDEAGPSGIRQQKITDIQEMTQATDVDPKTGDPLMDPLYIPDSKNFDDLFIKSLNVANTNNLEYSTVISIRSVSSSLHKSKHVGKRKMPGATKQGSHVKQNANEQNVKQKSIGNKRSSKSSLKCNKCGKRFRKEVIMIKHMNEPKYQCEKCRQVFCRQVDLNRHIATVHRHPIYSCSICEYKSNNRRTLTDHFIRKHTECEHPSCNQELDIQDERKQRTNQVHSGESIICSICGRVCKSVHALKKHMKFRHYKPQLVCEICHRSLSTQRNFDLHLKWHETRETVRCPTCDKKCRVRDLKQHVQTHNNAKPFSCPVCDKLFRWQSTQEQHMLIHTGKRSYICSICGLAFVQKRGLIVHRREHPKPLPPLPVVPIKSIIEGFLKEYTKKNAAKKTK